ncbi:MAG TPA: hypothetical protein VHZ78_11010 [Rhizomicrobium sp.]|jgi:hypothetical protein|nr:hypothetical protein [Rhizomicrobium sp.]
MSKYARLGTYLRESGGGCLPMTFAEIERVVGTKLPKSQKSQAWWSNSTTNNVMTQIWLDAGYRTEQVDVAARKLVFRRVETPRDEHPGYGLQEEPRMFKPQDTFTPPLVKVARHPAIGALKGMVTIAPGYDIASSDPEEVAAWEDAIDRKADLLDAGHTRK